MTGMRYLVAVLLLAVTACGAQPTAGPQSPPTTTRQTATTAPGTTTAPAADVPAELAFTSPTVGGGEFDGKSLFGKPAVLWFWAPWCPKCQREAPGIAAAAERSSGVTFLGVAANDTVEAMRGFIEERGVGGFEHLADTDARIWQHFGVAAQPAYAFVSSTGQVEVVTQQLGADELAAKVDALS